MDMYKIKFTVLQLEILRFLSIKAGETFTARAIAQALRVTPTAVAKALPGLRGLVTAEKDESNRRRISLDRTNPSAIARKRSENLLLLHESGLVTALEEAYPGATIILFGSYAYGEENTASDIDIAVIGSGKEPSLRRYERLLERPIRINQYAGWEIDDELRDNILNGIVLSGGVSL